MDNLISMSLLYFIFVFFSGGHGISLFGGLEGRLQATVEAKQKHSRSCSHSACLLADHTGISAQPSLLPTAKGRESLFRRSAPSSAPSNRVLFLLPHPTSTQGPPAFSRLLGLVGARSGLPNPLTDLLFRSFFMIFHWFSTIPSYNDFRSPTFSRVEPEVAGELPEVVEPPRAGLRRPPRGPLL